MLRLFPICLLMVAGIVGCDAPSLDSVGWLHHGSDQASTKYSPIDQINAENFSDLEFMEDDEIIDEAQDTLTILSKYVDSLNIEKKTELNSLMTDLYNEALTVETV